VRVSVVIPHYFAQREGNLTTIVEAYRAGTVAPDEIVIWNNDGPLSAALPNMHGVRLIQSAWNLGCKARFLGALVADPSSDWILFQDNDLAIERQGLETLIAGAGRHPDGIVSFEGRRVEPGKYKSWKTTRGADKPRDQRIDITLGRMELVRRDVLMRLLALFPFSDKTEMDDLAFSVCARDAGVKCFVVPYGPGTGFVRLSEHGVGMSVTHRQEYLKERDRVVSEWFRRAG
jgi:Glycosyl transferase family 2